MTWKLHLAAACPQAGNHAWSWRMVKPGAGFEDGTGDEAHANPYRLHLLALVDALPSAPDGQAVCVITTDSMLVDVLTRYLSRWEAAGFSNRSLKNIDLLEMLSPHANRLGLTAERLKSRTGNPHAKDCKLHARQASDKMAVPAPKTGASNSPASSTAPLVRSDVEVVAWTDGGSRINPGPSGWGAVVLHLGTNTTLTLRGGVARGTNNRMELMAIERALAAFTRPTRVEVRTDSKFAISVCTAWISGWKRRGWTRANGEPPVNLDVIQQLDPLLQRHDVVFTWVRGHTGEPGNERADELCNEAIDRVISGADPDLYERSAGPPFEIKRNPKAP